MRIIELELYRVIEKVRTARPGLASWLWASMDEVPAAFTVSVKSGRLSVRIEYPDGEVSRGSGRPAEAIGNVLVYRAGGFIVGFDIPAVRVVSEVNNLAAGLEDAAGRCNEEHLRVNHRLVAAFLRVYADELFAPGQ